MLELASCLQSDAGLEQCHGFQKDIAGHMNLGTFFEEFLHSGPGLGMHDVVLDQRGEKTGRVDEYLHGLAFHTK